MVNLKRRGGRGIHHGPDGVRDGLPDRTCYEDDVRDGEHGFPPGVVGEHPGDEATNKGPERRRCRDEFLRLGLLLGILWRCGIREEP